MLIYLLYFLIKIPRRRTLASKKNESRIDGARIASKYPGRFIRRRRIVTVAVAVLIAVHKSCLARRQSESRAIAKSSRRAATKRVRERMIYRAARSDRPRCQGRIYFMIYALQATDSAAWRTPELASSIERYRYIGASN